MTRRETHAAIATAKGKEPRISGPILRSQSGHRIEPHFIRQILREDGRQTVFMREQGQTLAR